MAGHFISLEGLDGSGKSTQARLLAEALRARGLAVTLTREPGGSPGAEEIRRLVLDGSAERWSPETEILLFTAARRDHLERVIRPALARGEIVITDRFADSTRVFQGRARADLAGLVESLHALTIGLEPELTLLFDLAPETALARTQDRSGGETRFEEMGLDFHRRVRRGFLDLAALHPGRFRRIAADDPAGKVAQAALHHVLALIAPGAGAAQACGGAGGRAATAPATGREAGGGPGEGGMTGAGRPERPRPAGSPAPAGDEAFHVEGAERPGRWLVTCDHATNRVPAWVNGGDLGLPPEDMDRHIAFDPGAAGVALELGRLLDSPVILSRFSRLVIDPNRGEDDPTLVMRLYDGTIIPANRRVGAAEIGKRLDRLHRPYHAACAALAAARAGRAIAAIHSFTPCLRGRPPRPWHVGILHSHLDRRLSLALIARLRAGGDLVVGDNEPYSGHLPGDSIARHALDGGRHNTLVEIRNDLIRDEPAQKAWAARLAPLLMAALEDAAQVRTAPAAPAAGTSPR